MRIKLPTLVASSLFVLAGTILSHAQQQGNTSKGICAEILANLRKEIGKDPSRVLLAVEDALAANEDCACEIITTAIVASKADSQLVADIVSCATHASPSMTSSILECALSAAPEAAAKIKQTMSKTLGTAEGDAQGNGKEIVTGKDIVVGKDVVVGKDIVVPEEEEDWESIGLTDINGVYLISPPSAICCKKKPIIEIIRKVPPGRKPDPKPRPATESNLSPNP